MDSACTYDNMTELKSMIKKIEQKKSDRAKIEKQIFDDKIMYRLKEQKNIKDKQNDYDTSDSEYKDHCDINYLPQSLSIWIILYIEKIKYSSVKKIKSSLPIEKPK